MELDRKLKTALDESRLLILGAQVLFGFQFEAAFQDLFATLPRGVQFVQVAGLLLLLLATCFLIAPSLHHQLVYGGQSRVGALRGASFFAGLSLLPLTFGLGASMWVVFEHLFGRTAGLVAGSGFTVVALALLYGLGFALGRTQRPLRMPPEEKATPLETRIEQLLTEARVIIPGGQALLGFQFIATLTTAFAELPSSAQLIHVAALCAVALAVLLLMTPAALHRIGYGGEDSEDFFRIGSALVTLAAVPLAIGISADVYVVFVKVTQSTAAAVTAGLGALGVFVSVWLLYPVWKRRQAQPQTQHR